MSTARRLDLPEDNLKAHRSVQHLEKKPASNFKRVTAFFLDSIFQGILIGLLNYLFAKGTPTFAGILSNLSVVWFYSTMPTYAMGQTLGKKLVGIKVVCAHGKTDLSLGQAVLRETLGKAVSGFFLLLGYLWAFFNKKKLSWHDILAKTRVIEE